MTLSHRFRWCRSVRCQAQEVWLVLTSVTGTRVALTWDPHLGWYEAPPTPIPCGLHSGFILIRDKVRLLINVLPGIIKSRLDGWRYSGVSVDTAMPVYEFT